MDLSPLEALVLPFLLIATRLTGLVTGFPTLVGELIPLRIRGAFVMVVAFVLTLSHQAIVTPDYFVLSFIGEFALGLLLGLVLRVAMNAAEFAAELVGLQLGFGFGSMVDPRTEEPSGPLTRMIVLFAGLLFFATDSYEQVLLGFSYSLDKTPPGAIAIANLHIDTLMTYVQDTMKAALIMAAPILFLTFLIQIIFGILTKVAPQLNMWSLGFSGTIGAGLFAMTMAAPRWLVMVQEQIAIGLTNFKTTLLG